MICAGCGSEIPEESRSCPQCQRLVHAAELQDLAEKARAGWRVGNFADERAWWMKSLELLPEDSVQYRSIQARVAEIDQHSAAAASSSTGWKKMASMGIGPLLLLVLAKGKLLLLGLTKIGTLLSMMASLGVYWAMYGWAFAAGVVFSIYIHEMGHVNAIRRYGFPASAPMFIPGLGAFIQLRGAKVPPVPDNRIGLAGPLYGLGATVAAYGLFLVTHAKIWAAIADFNAWVNLFNLIPIWQLDGSRGFHSLTRGERAAVMASALVMAILTGHRMVWLVALVAGYRLFTKDWQRESDREGMWWHVGLLAALSVVGSLAAGVAGGK